MTARSRHRGHRIEWMGHKWVYTDRNDTTKHGRERPCADCGKWSVGPDACLSKLPSVRQACCGHGRPEDVYFIFWNGMEVRGEEAIRLQECWQHRGISPSDVIEVYLRVRDVESTYQLCQMCNIGVVTVQELIKVIDTVCGNSLDIDPFCDILEVYSERNTNRETHMGLNTKAITGIQRQTDILSDGHQEVVDQAVSATEAIIALDDRMEKSKESGSGAGISMLTTQVHSRLETLQDQLQAQADRALRVRAEIERIKISMVII